MMRYFVFRTLEYLRFLIALLSLHIDGDVRVEGSDCEAVANVVETHTT